MAGIMERLKGWIGLDGGQSARRASDQAQQARYAGARLQLAGERQWLLEQYTSTALEARRGHGLPGGTVRLAQYVLATGDWAPLLQAARTSPPSYRQACHDVVKAGMRVPARVEEEATQAGRVHREGKQREVLARADELRTGFASMTPAEVVAALQAERKLRHPGFRRLVLAQLEREWNLALHRQHLAWVPVGETSVQERAHDGTRHDEDEFYRQERQQQLVANQMALRRRLDAEAALLAATGMADYLAFYPQARALARRMVFHVGPTNSGKTWGAMQTLAAAPNGVYLAPLRLLALEGYDTLVAKGVSCNLLTGDDQDSSGTEPTHTCSTIEMLDTTQRVGVCVVDEVQMLADPGRGWAWTRAIVGAAADTVIMVGSRDALPLVQKLCAMTGEQLEIVEHTRMSKLLAADAVSLDDLRPGDAVVAFSRRDLYRLREQISVRYPVSMLYGGLSPDVRRVEAERFRTGRTSILIASDAIGMGLNLPLERVVLAAGEKFDGNSFRALLPNEIRQICGRAGRGTNPGAACYLVGAEAILPTLDLQAVLDGATMQGIAQTPPTKCSIMPPYSAIAVTAQRQAHERLPDILRTLHKQTAALDSFAPADTTEMIAQATALARIPLCLQDLHTFSMAPIQREDTNLLVSWAQTYAGVEQVAVPMPSSARLNELEATGRRLTAWMWLSRHYPDAFHDIETARRTREQVDGLIVDILARRHIDSRGMAIQQHQVEQPETTDNTTGMHP